MKKIIIFDFDGTLVDSLHIFVNVFNEHASEFGFKQIDSDEVKILQNKGYMEIIREYKVPLLKIPSLISRGQKAIYEKADEFTLFPGIHEVITTLKKDNFTVGILTSNSKVNVEKILTHLDFMIFDFIYDEKNLFGKPAAFKNLLRSHKFNPQDVIYVGDEVRDIEAARKNNVECIAVTYGFNTKEILEKNNPTYVANSPQDIVKIIRTT